MATLRLYTLIVLFLASCNTARSGEHENQVFPALQKPVRLILSDIDGTLTTADYKLVKANIDGFKLARRLGIEVGFVTGRDPEYVRKFFGEDVLRELGYFGSPGIYLNGTFVVSRGGNVIVDAPFDQQLKERLLQAVRAHGVEDVRMGTASVSNFRGHGSGDAHGKHYTLFAIGDKKVLDDLRLQLEDDFGDEVIFTRCHPNSLGTHSAGFDKGLAVRKLASDLGLDLGEVLVMGDAENDLPMFGVAGTSVAVGNAQDALKKKADYITVDSSQGALLAVVQEIQRRGLYPEATSAALQAE